MTNEIFKTRKEIERKLAKINEEKMKLEQQKDDIEKKCEHEIVICTEQSNGCFWPIYDDWGRKYCLICGEDYGYDWINLNFPKKTVQINMNDYPKLCKRYKEIL